MFQAMEKGSGAGDRSILESSNRGKQDRRVEVLYIDTGRGKQERGGREEIGGGGKKSECQEGRRDLKKGREEGRGKRGSAGVGRK